MPPHRRGRAEHRLRSNGKILIGYTGINSVIHLLSISPQNINNGLEIALPGYEPAKGSPALSFPYLAWTDFDMGLLAVAKLALL